MAAAELPDEEEMIFQVAAALSATQRGGYLDAACAGRPEMRAAVERLLAGVDDEQFMKRAVDRTEAVETARDLGRFKPEEAGEMIGSYKLLQRIGEGGFGVVWMAEQEKPVRRRVALKIIKLGMDTKEVVARFEQERQALAMMDHPNIARVIDAGATPQGRPYFAMELVRGVKITEYCDQANLSTADRLKLFIQVCHAVQHAHQKGIIHRDLKPSNILVTLHDGVAVPKVIDFGVAKATQQQRLTDLTLFTQFEQMIGTPLYMSPEQAEMSGLDIDTRSDIYSLGVLLYELLTGRTPFDPKELLQKGLDEVRRVIREQEPQKPSTAISTMALDARTTVAGRRQTDSTKLIGLIRGDLDWIVMKALEKDRNRRYETANGLALDIGRHLGNEPVHARPPTPVYRFRRLVRRNKVAFAAASSVLVTLVLALAVSIWMFLHERKARERAVAAEKIQEQERQKATSAARKSDQVAAFLKKMLEGVGPHVALGRDTTLLRAILEETERTIGADLKDNSDVEADLRSLIGKVYDSLGDFAKSESMARQALALRKAYYGEEHSQVAISLREFGGALTEVGEYDEAEATVRRALSMQSKLTGPEGPEFAKTMTQLAYTVRRNGRLKEAESIAKEAVAMSRKFFSEDDEAVVSALGVLGSVVGWQGRGFLDPDYKEQIRKARRRYPEVHPSLANTLHGAAHGLRAAWKLEEAEKADAEALAIYRKLCGPNHWTIVETLFNLTETLELRGKLSEAEGTCRECLAMCITVSGLDHPMTLRAVDLLVKVLTRRGKSAEAETLVNDQLKRSRKEAGDEAPLTAWLLAALAEVRLKAGRIEDAESAANEAMLIHDKSPLRRNDARKVLTVSARVLEARGTPEKAEPLLREALELARSMESAWVIEDQLSAYGEYLSRCGRYAEAESMFREDLEFRRPHQAPEHIDAINAKRRLARVLRERASADESVSSSDAAHQTTQGKAQSLSRAQQAETILREIVNTVARDPDAEVADVEECRGELGETIVVATLMDPAATETVREARLIEAEKLLLQSHEVLMGSSKCPEESKRWAIERLVHLYKTRRKADQVAEWQRKLSEFKGSPGN